ncbi:BspA family leucine-rich repeat surface protein [Elizabethkingia anophelis]|uniref:BspA family leucine-rich repeat surface protein n=1 Tax=Elizabethkingia anophelis TaxID=1117645 RepID=UPI00320AE44A
MKTLILRGLDNPTKLLPPANSFVIKVVKKGDGTGIGAIGFGFSPWQIYRTLKIKGGVMYNPANPTEEVTELTISSGTGTVISYKLTGDFGYLSFNYVDSLDNIAVFREWEEYMTENSPRVDYNFTMHNVYDRNLVFANNKSFNQPIWGLRFAKYQGRFIPGQGWENAESMMRLFQNMREFNQPVSHLKPNDSKFTSFWFNGAWKFNQPLDMWDVSEVLDMGLMFESAYSFNQDITMWDVSKVLSMEQMFQNASSFNQDLSKWNFNKEVRLNNFLTRSGLDSENYGKLLKKLDSIDFTERVEAKVLGAEGLTYLKAYQVNKDSLVAKGWSIADAGASYQ